MPAVSKPATRTRIEAVLKLHSAGRNQEALDILTATAPGENLSDFYTLRGDIQFALNRFEEAAASYFTSATLDPHRDEVRLGLGACLLHLNRPEEALANFDRCWTDDARFRVMFGKAVALQLLGRYDDAEAAYQRVLASDSKSEEALSNLIALCIDAHDVENARRYSLQLLEFVPESAVALQGLATLALEGGEYEAAFRYCSRIVELAPDCVEAWHNLRFASGRVMTALRTPAEAIASTAGRK